MHDKPWSEISSAVTFISLGVLLLLFILCYYKQLQYKLHDYVKVNQSDSVWFAIIGILYPISVFIDRKDILPFLHLFADNLYITSSCLIISQVIFGKYSNITRVFVSNHFETMPDRIGSRLYKYNAWVEVFHYFVL